MPLFPRLRRRNRRGLEILQRIRANNDQNGRVVSKKSEESLRKVVSEANLPEEVEEFMDPYLGSGRLLGFVFSRFSTALSAREADEVVDGERRDGRLLELLLGFIERGGLQLILEFILSIISAFDD